MDFLIIGVFVGFIMGLTGAGGALVSIPLFVYLTGASLKDATVLSLVVVLAGALINLISDKAKSDLRIALSFLVFASAANYLSVSLKQGLPDLFIAALLSAIALYSLWSVWTGGQKKNERAAGKAKKEPIWKLALAGIVLGLTTTLTGLGGGVLLVPILMKTFGKTYAQAVPTSLLSIIFVSLTSLFFQRDSIINQLDWAQFALLTLGLIVSAITLRGVKGKISKEGLELSRKIVFSAVVVYAVGSLALKTL